MVDSKKQSVHFMVTNENFRHLENAAQKTGLSKSAYINKRLFNKKSLEEIEIKKIKQNKKEKATERIGITCTPTLKTHIEEQAEKYGLSQTELIRRVLGGRFCFVNQANIGDATVAILTINKSLENIQNSLQAILSKDLAEGDKKLLQKTVVTLIHEEDRIDETLNKLLKASDEMRRQ